jgi:hypothetical protein
LVKQNYLFCYRPHIRTAGAGCQKPAVKEVIACFFPVHRQRLTRRGEGTGGGAMNEGQGTRRRAGCRAGKFAVNGGPAPITPERAVERCPPPPPIIPPILPGKTKGDAPSNSRGAIRHPHRPGVDGAWKQGGRFPVHRQINRGGGANRYSLDRSAVAAP